MIDNDKFWEYKVKISKGPKTTEISAVHSIITRQRADNLI